MLVDGARLALSRWRLLALLYVFQLGVALLFGFVVWRALAGLYAGRPLFDRAVFGGDLAALASALGDHLDVVRTLAWLALALVLAWFILSLYLNAGLVGAFTGRPFAETAGARFFAFVRLFLLCLVPYAACVFVLLVGTSALAGSQEVRLVPLTGKALLNLAPAALLFTVASCATDHARVLLVTAEKPAALRALLAAWRVVLTSPRPLLHYLLYLLAWGGVSIGYVAATWGHAFAGAAGFAVLVVLRQLVAALRFLARAVTTAGQARFRGGAILPP